jgi:hypothetical protein
MPASAAVCAKGALCNPPASEGPHYRRINVKAVLISSVLARDLVAFPDQVITV